MNHEIRDDQKKNTTAQRTLKNTRSLSFTSKNGGLDENLQNK